MKTRMKKIIKKLIQIKNEKLLMPITNITDPNKLLDRKVALIVGGSGGIGMAIAKKFLESGAQIIITGTNNEKLRKCCQELGGDVKYITLNMFDITSFKGKISEASSQFGQIDILVCASGIHKNYNGLDFLNIDENHYDTVMDINLKGTYFVCQEIVKYYISNKIKGHILIISSQSALEPAWSPYRLSKHGIAEITKGIAQRVYQYGITVNAIGPGPTATSMQDYEKGNSINTDQNPLRRYTMPEEIAEYAKLMVSDLGNTIIGDTLYMSGGRGIVEIR